MQTNNVASRASVTIPPVINNMDISLKYALFQLLQDRHANDSLESSLVYAPVINITINNNIGTINNITNNYGKDNKVDKSAATKTWIDEHPPYDRQNTADYYKIYTDSVKDKFSAMCIQKFTVEVINKKYRQMRDGGKRVWVKKTK